MELMGTLIGSRLTKYVKTKLIDIDVPIYLWTDSNIALHWIKGEPKKFKPFVQNRVLEIQNNVLEATWRHCPGIENPADLLTRGEKIKKLEKSSIWWTGPKWLKEDAEMWPTPDKNSGETIAECSREIRKQYAGGIASNACIVQKTEDLFNVEKYSNLMKIYRITAWCLRYVNNIRNPAKISGPLTTEEMKSAEKYWIRQIQKENFMKEINSLKMDKQLKAESRLSTLNPFLDKDDIIRVGGRLHHSNLEYEQMHPIVLPDKGHLINMIIFYNHQIIGHGGVADTLCQIRKKFWLLRSRKRIKTVLFHCNGCKRFRAKPVVQDMAPLPPDRCRRRLKHQRLWRVWKHLYLMDLRTAHHTKTSDLNCHQKKTRLFGREDVAASTGQRAREAQEKN